METTCDELHGLMRRETHYRVHALPISARSQSHSAFRSAESSPTEHREHDHGQSLCRNYRQKLCHWVIDVVEYYALEKTVVAWTMNYMDRILAKSPQVLSDQGNLHLLLLGCFFLASKLSLSNSACLPPTQLVLMTQLKYTQHDLLAVERDILVQLEWLVHPPTTDDFLVRYLMLLAENYDAVSLQALYEQCLAISKIVLLDGEASLRSYLPSVLAVAILYYCMVFYREGSPEDSIRPTEVNPLPELHRHGIYVHAFDSIRCAQEIVQLLDPPEHHYPQHQHRHQQQNQVDTEVEEKDTIEANRIASPVDVSLQLRRSARRV